MAFEIKSFFLINKHDVAVGIKNDQKFVEVESSILSEKERLGILVSVNL